MGTPWRLFFQKHLSHYGTFFVVSISRETVSRDPSRQSQEEKEGLGGFFGYSNCWASECWVRVTMQHHQPVYLCFRGVAHTATERVLRLSLRKSTRLVNHAPLSISMLHYTSSSPQWKLKKLWELYQSLQQYRHQLSGNEIRMSDRSKRSKTA